MKRRFTGYLALLTAVCLGAASVQAADSFKKLVGPVKVGPVDADETLEVPYLTWGGDAATFHANGGKTTDEDSIFGKLGLKLELAAGDDFIGQVREYMKGKSPFLRGTMRMIGMASEVVGGNDDTKPVVFLQLTWSAGDHLVAREGVKSLNDLKGKKVVLQQGGPHVGMLDDALKAAKLSWDDITVVWTDELTGEKGPAAMFKKDRKIDVCAVISPDMVGLCGGLEEEGSGSSGTVKGSHVLISTATMSRSIADVYACRKDFYDANKEVVAKFAAGYLKACEEIVEMKEAFEDKGSNADYLKVLKLTQKMFGKEVIPTPEEDAHGLISDCSFVGRPGNEVFFSGKGNTSFAGKQAAALDLAVEQGYASQRVKMLAHDLDYGKLAGMTKLKAKKETKQKERFTGVESAMFVPVDAESKAKLDRKTVLSFTIYFEPDQSDFSVEKYGKDFLRAVEAAGTFGNAAIAVRGHADPTLMLRQAVQAGMANGHLKQTGETGNYKYTLDGEELDLEDTAAVLKLIKAGKFSGGKADPEKTMKGLIKLSQDRGDAVRDAIVKFAKSKSLRLDASQIKAVGVGGSDPAVAKPASGPDMAKNRRVEFRLVSLIGVELPKGSGGFDF